MCLRKGYFKPIIIWLVLLISWNPLEAKIIEPESLLDQLVQSYYGIYQFYVEADVKVYDPEVFAPLDDAIGDNFTPYEVKSNNFTQHYIWVRDEYELIETVDQEGTALHYYIKAFPGISFSRNLADYRSFSDFDVLFPALLFYTKHASIMVDNLASVGIVPDRVSIVKYQNDAVYQLGSDKNHVKVDPNNFKVLEIFLTIQVAGKYYPLTIEFTDWDPQKTELPRKTSYYINSRLLKTIHVAVHERGMGNERNEFIKKYRDEFPPVHPLSTEVHYGK